MESSELEPLDDDCCDDETILLSFMEVVSRFFKRSYPSQEALIEDFSSSESLLMSSCYCDWDFESKTLEL